MRNVEETPEIHLVGTKRPVDLACDHGATAVRLRLRYGCYAPREKSREEETGGEEQRETEEEV